MKSLKYQFAVLLALSVAGCATAPSTKTPETADNKRLQESAKIYKKSLHSIAQSDLQTAACPKVTMKTKNWNWREAVDMANACLKANDLARAEEIGNELATRDPAAPWGPYFLAAVARERGQLERALWMSELAMKRAPEVGILHYLKGQVLWSKKEYSPAVASLEKSTELDPTILPAHLFLGQIYFRDQEYKIASKHFYAVLKVQTRNPVALSGLAESELHEKNPRGAIDAYYRLADSYPKDGQYLARIGEIYETVMSDSAQALSVYRNLKDQVRNGRVRTNIDPQLDMKIKSLEAAVNPAARSMASSEEKTRGPK